MDDDEPRGPAVTFATTEHFTLQTARAATTAESNGRANIFLAAVSGGLVALAFVGQATSLDRGFIVFGLVLLPVLLFIGLATFDRVLELGVEDLSYAERINNVRRFYLDAAPELAPYLEASSTDRTEAVMVSVGLRPGRLQPFLTAAGMVEVIDAVLAGAVATFVVEAIDDDVVPLAITVGVAAGIVCLGLLHRVQTRAWHCSADARGRH